jgi:hypothetical protein
MPRDYYAVLNISPKAEQEVIDGAYRRLALKYHPALNPSASTYERMREINEAWEVLSDPGRRARYDRSRLYTEATKAVGQAESQGSPSSRFQAAPKPRAERISRASNVPPENLYESRSIWRAGIGITVLLVALLSLVGGQGRFVWIEAIILCASWLTFSFFRKIGTDSLEWLGLAALSVASVVILALAFPEFNLAPWNVQAVSSSSSNVLSAALRTPSPGVTVTRAQGCPRGCAMASFACGIRARVNPDGNRVYYLPSDRGYDETARLPASSDHWFCSEAEATANGWIRDPEGPTATATPDAAASVTPLSVQPTP